MDGSGHIHPGPSSTGLGWTALLDAAKDSLSARLQPFLAPTELKELLSLAAENDPGLWAQGLLSLADRLQRRGKMEPAQVLWQALAVEGSVPEELRATVDLARRRLAAASGGGNLGDRAETLVNGFWKAAADPYGLLGFAVGGTVFKLSRAVFFSRLLGSGPSALTRGWGAKLLSQAGAFGAEVPAFVLSAKASRHWVEAPQEWNRQTLGRELLSTGLTLFFLKATGGLNQAAWGRRPVPAAFQQAALYGGILLGQRVEHKIDHLQALATLFQFNVAGRMTDGILGGGFRRAMEGLELRSRDLDREWFGEASRELFPHYVLSTGSGDGKGPGDKGGPKIIELFPMAQEGKAKPVESNPIDPDQSLSRARTLAHEAQEHYAKLLSLMATFRAAAEIQAGLMEKGRGEATTSLELKAILAQQHREFLEQLARGQAAVAELRELHFITAAKPALHELAQSLRQKIKALHESSSDLAAGFEILEKGLERGNIYETLKVLASWSSLFPVNAWPRAVFPIDFEAEPAQGLKVARLAGMMYGAVAKDVLRGAGLDARSPRAEDVNEASDLLADLFKAEGRDYSQILLRQLSPQSLRQAPLPREVLQHLGTYEQPFQSWFSLHLPALLLFHRGRSAEVLEKIKAIELFMTPEDRQANRLILDWLSMALEREGHPRDWAGEPVTLDSGTGPLAIFAHSVDVFVRHSTEPGPALRAALAAPPPIREDVASLTGALVGAYLGRSAFGSAWLLPSIHRAFPEKKVNSKLEASWLLDTRHMAFENPAQLAFDYSAVLRPLVRSIGPAKGLVPENPVWTAFMRGLGERQAHFETLMLEAVKIAAQFVAADPAAIQGRQYFQFHDFLDQEMKRIDPSLKDLRGYIATARARLAEFGLPGEPPLWNEIEAKLLRFDEAFAAYAKLVAAARLNVERIGHFASPEQVRAEFQERILEFDRAFGRTGRSESAIRGEWVRRLSATMGVAAKKQKILDLVTGRAEAKSRKVSRRDLKEFESVLDACPEYLLSDLAHWSETDSLLAKAWLLRLGLLPKGSSLRTDPEVLETLEGKTVEQLRPMEVEEVKAGIFFHYTIRGSRLLPQTYRALNASERMQWRAKIDQLPPILGRSLLESGIRGETILLLLHELGLSRLGIPPKVD